MTALALIGAYLNAEGNLVGFYCWIVTNFFFCAQNILLENYPLAALFAAYGVITLRGIFAWRKKERTA